MQNSDVMKPLVKDEEIKKPIPSFRGEVVLPSDIKYYQARQAWNGMIDRYPAVIARCTRVEDVVASVNLARENKLLATDTSGW